MHPPQGFEVGSVVKNLPADIRDSGEAGSIPGSGRSPGGEHGKPSQYSCLENPMHIGAWWATISVQAHVHGYTHTKDLLDVRLTKTFNL